MHPTRKLGVSSNQNAAAANSRVDTKIALKFMVQALSGDFRNRKPDAVTGDDWMIDVNIQPVFGSIRIDQIEATGILECPVADKMGIDQAGEFVLLQLVKEECHFALSENLHSAKALLQILQHRLLFHPFVNGFRRQVWISHITTEPVPVTKPNLEHDAAAGD
jgi:hypothetical protein